MAQAKNKEVAAFELKVAQKQGEYLDRLRTVQDSIATAQQVAAIGQDAAWWDKLIYNVQNLGTTINNYAQRAAVAAETKMSEWINDVIRFVGELIFQMSYYGILVAQRIFMAIMVDILPHHVRPLPRPAVELGMEPVDVEIPLPLALGFRDLHVPLLYRLYPPIQPAARTWWPTTTSCTAPSTHGRKSAHSACRASDPTACTPWVCSWGRTSSVLFPKWPHG